MTAVSKDTNMTTSCSLTSAVSEGSDNEVLPSPSVPSLIVRSKVHLMRGGSLSGSLSICLSVSQPVCL